MAKKKVIILGGGVGGMSAAHELAERGYEVEIYERNPVYSGGKARSINYYGNHIGQHYEDPLPGEHGFRFFPGFYKHIIDTMKRIPFTMNGKQSTVFDNLVSTTREYLARHGNLCPMVVNASFPKNLKDIELVITDLHGTDTGLTENDKKFFAERVWQIITSCTLRRDNDYERMGWWEYMEANTDKFSPAYKSLLVEGLLHTLIAAHAETASTKTAGDIFLQLIFCMSDPTVNTDRVLDGPTNERWLNPWLDYLKSKGVKYFLGHEVTAIHLANEVISSATVVDESGVTSDINGDYFILAVPVERSALLISEEIVKADKTLAYIKVLAKSVNWMNGIQFYLNENVTITNGHIICLDTHWALTAFSQIQFWKNYDITKKGNKNVKGLLSVDISEWFKKGNFNKKCANDCTHEEIMKEAWAQLKYSLNVEGTEILKDEMIVDWCLDRDIVDNETTLAPLTPQNPTHKRVFVLPDKVVAPGKFVNDIQPLLVNTVNTWGLRPEANCAIPNLFFAADYVRTYTDLATMECANEAARRAVNCLMVADNNDGPICRIWPLQEPKVFMPFKWYDEVRYRKGLPWQMHTPWWLKLFMAPWTILCLAEGFVRLIIVKIFGRN